MKEIIINVDAYNENSIRTVEGDNLSEVYKIYILKNKRRIDLTNKIAVMAYVDEYGSKRSNILNLNITNAAEGEIELPITNIISEHNGVYACQVAIYGENNSLEQTAPFSLIVENNIFSKISNTAINSTDFHILSEAIKTTNSYAEKLKQGTENIELQYADKLNEKMNKDDVLSMANMGQDVKEAMTGGSVAVVGENAVDTINLRDESVTSSKTTDVGSNAHIALNGTLNIDYKNRKYIFPDNTHGMLFWKNKRYDIPANTTIELVDQYECSSLWFNTTTKTFISRGYVIPPDLEDEILICVVNNGTVQCICDVSYNGEIYKPKGLKIGMDNIMPVANYYNFYTNGVVDFNYNKNKVIIPDIKIFVGKNTFSFNSKELSLLDNANQILVFNNNTKELELVPFDITAPINYKVVDSNVILAMFDRLCTTIITDLPYIKNGIEFIEPGLKLKDYYSTENEKVEEKLLDDTTGDFTFGCITDIHHNKFFDATQEIMAFNKFSKDNMLDFRFCFGDMIDGFIDKETDYRDIKKVMSVFKEAGDNFAIARGNHDTGFIGYTKPVLSDTPKIDDIVSKKAWDSLTCTHLGDRAVFDEKNPTGGYFYIDFKKYKIRVIVLNTSDFEVFNESGKLLLNPMNCYIKPRQIEWFGDVALKNVERDYAVLVISHANLDTRGDSAYGSMEAQKILNGFKTGTTVTIEKNNVEIPKLNYNFNFDFTEQGSREVICCLSGHSHYDRVLEKDGIKYISINNASPSKTDSQYVPEGAEVFDRARDSLTESSFDIIRIDKKNKKILLKRFGAGHDREINY